jgi:amidase
VTLAPETTHWHGMSVFGFVTRSVLDTALLLDAVTSGEQMATAPPRPERPFAGAAGSDPGKLRIAWSVKPLRGLAPPKVTDEVKGAVSSTAELLAGLGHEVERKDPKWGSIGNRIMPRYLGGIRDEVAGIRDKDSLESRTQGIARLGKVVVTKGGLEKAISTGEEKDRARLDQQIFAEHDVLIMSPVGEPPVEIGKWDGRGALRTILGMSRTYPFCPVWNHTGQPACSVPAGFTDDGLPLSVMLIGRPNDEATLLSLAAQIESARPWAERRPRLASA